MKTVSSYCETIHVRLWLNVDDVVNHFQSFSLNCQIKLVVLRHVYNTCTFHYTYIPLFVSFFFSFLSFFVLLIGNLKWNTRIFVQVDKVIKFILFYFLNLFITASLTLIFIIIIFFAVVKLFNWIFFLDFDVTWKKNQNICIDRTYFAQNRKHTKM